MVAPRAALGDSHNFGRRVTLRAGRVAKPRALLWEWALLGADSPVRKLLADISEREGMAGLFSFLPTLRFFPGRAGSSVGGEVERIALEPWRFRALARRLELAAIVGRSLALWSWLGVSDLHWENLVLGVDREGRAVFGPLDIELMFAVLALPTATKLLPDPDPEYAQTCRHASGVRRVLPYLGKPIAAEQRWAVLFPDRESLGDRAETRSGSPLDPTSLAGIIVLDGTWSKAKTLWWRNPWLNKLSRVSLQPDKPSIYGRMRAEPRREFVSTLESVAAALTLCGESPAIQAGLERVFRTLVQRVRDAGLVPTTARRSR